MTAAEIEQAIDEMSAAYAHRLTEAQLAEFYARYQVDAGDALDYLLAVTDGIPRRDRTRNPPIYAPLPTICPRCQQPAVALSGTERMRSGVCISCWRGEQARPCQTCGDLVTGTAGGATCMSCRAVTGDPWETRSGPAWYQEAA